MCGAPHTIIVAGAGLRAADLVRYEAGFSHTESRGTYLRLCGCANHHQQSGQEISEKRNCHSKAGRETVRPKYTSTMMLTACSQFAKHFKVEEQTSFLEKSRTGIAVGTPQRLIDLIENGTATCIHSARRGYPSANSCPDALSLENLRRIVVDASHIDQKKRGILDMRETMMPLARLLSRAELKEKYTDTDHHIDLIFF